MSDITKCEGKDCPLKETCYRFTAKASEYRQSYFTEPPYNVEENKCNSYWKINDKLKYLKACISCRSF